MEIISEISNRIKYPLTHIKPHGALNNMACEDFQIAITIGKVIKKFNKDLIYIVLPLTPMHTAAKKLDLKNGDFINADIEEWESTQKFDIIFSMETFYYFKDINKVLSNIYNNIISDDGFIFIGIDHYLENTTSLNWDKEFNLLLNTLSIKEWVDALQSIGFKDVQYSIFGKKENWHGTLILYSIKK